MRGLPITINHDHNRVNGFLYQEDGRFYVEFDDPVHHNMMINASYHVLEGVTRRDGHYIKKAEILSLSVTLTIKPDQSLQDLTHTR